MINNLFRAGWACKECGVIVPQDVDDPSMCPICDNKTTKFGQIEYVEKKVQVPFKILNPLTWFTRKLVVESVIDIHTR